MSAAYGPIIAVVLIVFAVIVGGLGVVVMLALAGYLLMGRGGAAEEPQKKSKKSKAKSKAKEVETKAAPGPPPVPEAVAAAAAASKSDFADEKTATGANDATEGDGATEVFHKDVHSRLMGWDDEEEDEEEPEAATQLFTKDQLQAQYADLLDDDEEEEEDYALEEEDDDDDGGGLPGKVVAE